MNVNVITAMIMMTNITELLRIPDKMPQDKMPQIRHGQNATERKPDKMPQSKNVSKL